MIKKYAIIPIFGLMLGGMSAQADVLELKNGNVLNGTFHGGTATAVEFEAYGNVLTLATSEIATLTFSTPPAPAAPAPQAAPPSPPQPVAVVPREVTLPAGTQLLVRMKDSVSSQSPAGTPFTTRLEYDLYADGVKVVPGGAVIYGTVQSSSQARRARGHSTLDLRLTRIALAGGNVTIVSSPFQQAGERAIKDAARGAAAGAAIGALVDGSDGAAEGAAIGAVAGALKRGDSIVVPPNTMLEFSLTQPVTIKVGN
ncbi:MAG: YMGG-like glycine zipper-containing protein [Opitutaceae bacterium]